MKIRFYLKWREETWNILVANTIKINHPVVMLRRRREVVWIERAITILWHAHRHYTLATNQFNMEFNGISRAKNWSFLCDEYEEEEEGDSLHLSKWWRMNKPKNGRSTDDPILPCLPRALSSSSNRKEKIQFWVKKYKKSRTHLRYTRWRSRKCDSKIKENERKRNEQKFEK